MRKLTISLLLMVAVVSAQEIYGEWIAQRTGEILKLSEDGSYMWGSSVGNFWIEEGSILFRDAATDDIASYALGFGGDVMQFTDYWMGARTLFVRKGSPAENLPPTILEDVESVSPPLAEKDGFWLREEDTELAFEVLHFIIGEALSEEEGSQLVDAWIAEFKAAPAEFKARIGSFASARDELYRTPAPWEVGKLRQRLLSEIHKESKDLPTGEQSAFIRAVYRHLEVLVFNEKETPALTDRDLEAYLDYVTFLITLSTGKPTAWPQAQRDSVASRIVSEFPTYPLAKREFLCSAKVLLGYFGYAWDEADAAERGRIAKGMLGDAAASDVDYGMLAPGVSVTTAKGKMDDATLAALAKLLAMDHKAAMKTWAEGRSWPYYYEILTP